MQAIKWSWFQKVLFLLAANLLSYGSIPNSPGENEGWQVRKTDAGIEVEEHGKKVLFWQTAEKSIDGRFTRSNYIHPLYQLDGQVLTDDFPTDHLHHRGVFWAWHFIQLNGERVGDSWELKDFKYVVQKAESQIIEGTCQLRGTVRWYHKPTAALSESNVAEKPIADEVVTITVYPVADNRRRIDFEIEIQANFGDLALGGSEDEKGYGGFSVRARFPKNLKFLSEEGELEPQLKSVAGGGWLDFSGEYPDAAERQGIAMMVPPVHPHYPLPWILRASGSMQNAAFPGRQPVQLPKGQKLKLNYGLLIHCHSLSENDLKREYELYVKRVSKTPTSPADSNHERIDRVKNPEK